jgi:hypothetical protein
MPEIGEQLAAMADDFEAQAAQIEDQEAGPNDSSEG